MYVGSVPTGAGELPGPVVQVPLHIGGEVASDAANPLNADGASPPLSGLRLDQFEPQNVTAVPVVGPPITNAPRDGKANTIAVFDTSLDDR